MKGKKLLAVLLAALMTASSVSITTFAEDENSEQPKAVENTTENIEQNTEEDDIVLFGAEAQGVSTYAVQIGDDGYATLGEAMESLSERTGDIVIKLTGTVSYEYDGYNSGTDYDNFTKNYTGGTITFKGTEENRGTVLNLHGKNTDYTMINNKVKVLFENLTINKTNAGTVSQHWSTNAIMFDGKVEFNDVTVNRSVRLGSAATFKNVNFNENDDYYPLWIAANVADPIVVDGCEFTSNYGRFIKVADENVTATATKIDLTVKNSTFSSSVSNKSAILVTSTKGADITASDNNISGVLADNTNLVWVDEASANYADTVTVRDENGKIVNAVKVENGDVVTKTAVAEINGVEYVSLQDAVDNADNDSTITILSDIEIEVPTEYYTEGGTKYRERFSYVTVNNKKLTFDFDNHKISLSDNSKANLVADANMFMWVYNNSDITFTGNGEIEFDCGNDNIGCYIVWLRGMANSYNYLPSKLTVESGTYKSQNIFYVSGTGDDGRNKGGEITITGGTFASIRNNDGYNQYINVAGNTMTDNKRVIINGGTFNVDPRYYQDNWGSVVNGVTDSYMVDSSKYSVAMKTVNGKKEFSIISNDDIVATVDTKLTDSMLPYIGMDMWNKVKITGLTYSYTSLADAIANANDGDVITLKDNANGDGAIIEKNITIDLNGKTYTLSGRAVGSPGYETSAFQLLADNVTFKNGTLTTAENVTCHNNTDGDYTAKANMLIQNYSNLTLDGVTLDGTNLRDTGYTLSNCKGNVEIKNSKINTNGKTFAFDVDNSRGTNQSVTVTNSEIDGFVEISGNDGKDAKLVSGTNEYKENGTYVQSGDRFIKAEKRSIEISANNTEVEMNDTVEISVTLKGNNIANAVYDLAYDTTKFELVSASTGTTASNGSLSEMLYKTDGACYENGAVLATYTFKALGQTENVTADFVISNTAAATYLESIDATNIKTTNNEKVSVAIKLKEYAVAVSVDNNVETGTTLTVPYTNEGHTFSVIATPAAAVSYKVNGGDETNSVSVSERGTYTIEYTITPETGYAKVTGTFTLVIGDPEYVVEVNLTNSENRDYVSGKKIVLVYTNTDGLAFNYGDDLMIDVTARGYKYNDTDEYSHVYAFVTDAIENSDAGVTVEDYKNNISCVIPSPADLIKLTYTMDLNFDSYLTVNDITTAYGIYNANEDYFKNVKNQKKFLRADTDGNKCVNNDDANAVVDAVKNK